MEIETNADQFTIRVTPKNCGGYNAFLDEESRMDFKNSARRLYARMCRLRETDPMSARRRECFPYGHVLIVMKEDHPYIDSTVEVVCFHGVDGCLKKYLKDQRNYDLPDYSRKSVRHAAKSLAIELLLPPFREKVFDRVIKRVKTWKAPAVFPEPRVWVAPYVPSPDQRMPFGAPMILTREPDGDSGCSANPETSPGPTK